MPALTDAQRERFQENGFLILDKIIPDPTLTAIRAEYAALLDDIARDLLAAGRIAETFEHLDFDARYAALLAAAPEQYQRLDISLPMVHDLAPDATLNAGAAVFGLLTGPALLAVVEDLIGPEIYCNPIQHTRIKMPEALLPAHARENSNIARTLWHQDAAVALAEAAATEMLTVWVAITDATREMGCMVAVPGSHRFPDLAPHCPGRSGVGEIYIPEALVEPHPVVPLEVGAGGVVLLHRRTWHGAYPNTSERLRWSFDLRYQPPGQPTGRECFPGFLAASRAHPEQVLRDPAHWRASWLAARDAIVGGRIQARFNERWEINHTHPLCA